MRVDTNKIFRSPNYEFSWPTRIPSVESGLQPLPPEEQLVIKCMRLSYEGKRIVEDGMVSVSGAGLSKASKATSTSEMKSVLLLKALVRVIQIK
jgi:hypothetical protein